MGGADLRVTWATLARLAALHLKQAAPRSLAGSSDHLYRIGVGLHLLQRVEARIIDRADAITGRKMGCSRVSLCCRREAPLAGLRPWRVARPRQPPLQLRESSSSISWTHRTMSEGSCTRKTQMGSLRVMPGGRRAAPGDLDNSDDADVAAPAIQPNAAELRCLQHRPHLFQR